MKYEPARFEIFLTKLAFILYAKSVYRAFADCLPIVGNELVLDFGCGMGTVAYYTAKRLKDGHLTCLEISGRWLNTCRKTLRGYENVTFLHAEATALPEERFDVVYCHFVLHDIPEIDLQTVLPALVKALRPGGSLVFREPLRDTEKLSLIRRLITHSGLHHKESRVIHIPVTGSTLESIYIKNNGGVS